MCSPYHPGEWVSGLVVIHEFENKEALRTLLSACPGSAEDLPLTALETQQPERGTVHLSICLETKTSARISGVGGQG